MIELHSLGHRHWETSEDTPADQAVLVIWDNTFETECDEPHPVRMRLDEFKSHYAEERYALDAFHLS